MGIDFVLAWVDGNDPEWKREFSRWFHASDGDKRELRYRDWGLLRYVFRAFEQYTPWVRIIHFITWGHLPEWLNASHPKLNIVKHEDYLKAENLPTFNSHAIEVNMHRISGLSTKFVYFNDDTFLLRPTKPERFFKNGAPRDIFAFNAVSPTREISHIILNNVRVINKYFNKKRVIFKHFGKLFRPEYGIELIKTVLLLPWPQITGFFDPHQPQAFLKATFEEVWQKERELLERTSSSKFRNNNDVSQYLFRYWQLLSGNFCPVSFYDAYSTSIGSIEKAKTVANLISNQRYRMLCINDAVDSGNEHMFQKAKSLLLESFERILPMKSTFEK